MRIRAMSDWPLVASSNKIFQFSDNYYLIGKLQVDPQRRRLYGLNSQTQWSKIISMVGKGYKIISAYLPGSVYFNFP